MQNKQQPLRLLGVVLFGAMKMFHFRQGIRTLHNVAVTLQLIKVQGFRKKESIV